MSERQRALEAVQGRTKERALHLERAQLARDDDDVAGRIAAQLCAVCFYLDDGAIYGRGATSDGCVFCLNAYLDGDSLPKVTKADDLCMPCARKHRLCRRCMADLHLKTRRKI